MQTVLLEDSRIALKWPVFACRVSDCNRIYDVWLGYLDVIDGRPAIEKALKVPCPDHETALNLQSWDRWTGVGLWRCPEAACDYNQGDYYKPSSQEP